MQVTDKYACLSPKLHQCRLSYTLTNSVCNHIVCECVGLSGK